MDELEGVADHDSTDVEETEVLPCADFDGSASGSIVQPDLDEETTKESESVVDGEEGSASVRPTDEDIHDLLVEVRKTQIQITAEFERELQKRDLLIDQLKSALEDARQDQVSVLLMPPVKALIDILAAVSTAASKDYASLEAEEVNENLSAEFEFIAGKAKDAVAALGFDEIRTVPGDPFDSKLHRASGKRPTTDEDLDKTVNAVARPGFCRMGASRASFPAVVSVNVFESEENDE
jgi:GrpE.